VNPGRADLRGIARDRAKLHRNEVRRHPSRLRRLALRHSLGVHIALMAQRHCIVGFVSRQRPRLRLRRQPGTRLDP
jgi:hypothetical protein